MATFKSSSPTTDSPITKAFKPAIPIQTTVNTIQTPSKTKISFLQQTNIPASCYSLEPAEVRRILDAKLNHQPYDEKQFLYYHLNRNYFNMKNIVTTLTQVWYSNGYRYKDNLGHVWVEFWAWQNMYHMPDNEWIEGSIPFKKPYSRKFVRDDDVSGVGGEFEMVILQNGQRINAGPFQETYNYGRTSFNPFGDHIKLDVDPHKLNPNYAPCDSMGNVEIKGLF